MQDAQAVESPGTAQPQRPYGSPRIAPRRDAEKREAILVILDLLYGIVPTKPCGNCAQSCPFWRW